MPSNGLVQICLNVDVTRRLDGKFNGLLRRGCFRLVIAAGNISRDEGAPLYERAASHLSMHDCWSSPSHHYSSQAFSSSENSPAGDGTSTLPTLPFPYSTRSSSRTFPANVGIVGSILALI